MKNMRFNFNHDNLGKLTAVISSGDSTSKANNIIPATFFIKNKDKDTNSFLFSLYETFAINNDIMADIIGEYLVDSKSLSNEEIYNEINKRYSEIIQKKNNKFAAQFSENDGIDAQIIDPKNPNEPLYSAKIIVTKFKNSLYAHIDEQITNEEFRKQGLMTIMINKFLPIYCAKNNLSAITLETGEIDGVDKITLEKIYKNLGFEKYKDMFIKHIDLEAFISTSNSENFNTENNDFSM